MDAGTGQRDDHARRAVYQFRKTAEEAVAKHVSVYNRQNADGRLDRGVLEQICGGDNGDDRGREKISE